VWDALAAILGGWLPSTWWNRPARRLRCGSRTRSTASAASTRTSGGSIPPVRRIPGCPTPWQHWTRAKEGLTTDDRDRSVSEPRAHELRTLYHAHFEGPELPVPVAQIANDLLGVHVEQAELDGLSGLLYLAERRVVNSSEPRPARRRFTLAHELGH
jgi:hypothetical protein